MRRLICTAIVIALFTLGCGNGSGPAEEPAAGAAPEATPISTEDFESGEAEGIYTDEAEPATTPEAEAGNQGAAGGSEHGTP